MDNRPIAIIDSGLGGLSIAQAIWKQLPHQATLYLADHKFFPYGGLDRSLINRRLTAIFNYIMLKNCKAAVIACNTITNNSISWLRELYPIPIIGTEPAIKPALEANLHETVLVWATPQTVASRGFKLLCRRLDQHGQIKALPCPNLAVEIETMSGQALLKKLKLLIKASPQPFSALVLGCTHYILIKDQLKHLLPPQVLILEPSQAIASQTEKILTDNRLLPGSGPAKLQFLTTGQPKTVSRTATRLLGRRIIFKACTI